MAQARKRRFSGGGGASFGESKLSQQISEATGIKLGKPPSRKLIGQMMDAVSGAGTIFKAGGKVAKAGAKAVAKKFTAETGDVVKQGVKKSPARDVPRGRGGGIEKIGVNREKLLMRAGKRAKPIKKGLLKRKLPKAEDGAFFDKVGGGHGGGRKMSEVLAERIMGKAKRLDIHPGRGFFLRALRQGR